MYISISTLLSRRAWFPPAFGTSCPALMLAPPTLTILPLRGSMIDSPSRTPPTGSTAPLQRIRHLIKGTLSFPQAEQALDCTTNLSLDQDWPLLWGRVSPIVTPAWDCQSEWAVADGSGDRYAPLPAGKEVPSGDGWLQPELAPGPLCRGLPLENPALVSGLVWGPWAKKDWTKADLSDGKSGMEWKEWAGSPTSCCRLNHREWA